MDILPLTGLWLVSLASPAPQFPQSTLPPLSTHVRIELPGTTETRSVSPFSPVATPLHLGRTRPIEGPVLYHRDVEIPASAEGKWGEFVIERTKLAQAWWDDSPLGTSEKYLSEAVFPLPDALRPGHHRLTVLVDNTASLRPIRSEAHQFSDNTQTNWNGLLGCVELRIKNAVDLNRPTAYPDIEYKTFDVLVPVVNRTKAPVEVQLSASGESFNHPGAPHGLATSTVSETVAPGLQTVRLRLPLGEGAKAWDEFSPALYRLRITLQCGGLASEQIIETGYRDFASQGSHFTINGRRTFLRGKHDGCVFPLTGHPPMDLAGWLAYFKTCQEWGINHVRFHTWVPPEAAFQAADRLGIYLQPELPFWGEVTPPVQTWMKASAREAIAAYANHPSFVMFTLGNELYGDHALLNEIVSELRHLDPSRLFSDGSNNFLWKPEIQPTNQFMVTAKVVRPGTEEPLSIRGSFCFADDRDRRFGLVQWNGDDTRLDFESALQGLPIPLVSHEIGQYSMYPDFNDITRYTGVTRATNLEFFKTRAAASGVLPLNAAFVAASGKHAAELYREEIEAALRTASMGGFQLLDLQDFPGQGTALVGVLNAFMEPKGAITAEEWRSFCGPTVPLARFSKRVWSAGESFIADIEVSHFGPRPLTNVSCEWSLADSRGFVVAKGTQAVDAVKTGGLARLARAECRLPASNHPIELTLAVRVSAKDGEWRQSWDLWMYPKIDDVTVPENVLLAKTIDEAMARLSEGGRVLLMPEKGNWAETLSGAYATDFWNWRMFNNPPGTLGLLIDDAHPALREFPSRSHSDRRWAAIAMAATPVLLGDSASQFTVPVRVIDNFERNEPLGLVFETRVGEGRLLVCGVDLLALKDRPEASSLLKSLIDYSASENFYPEKKCDPKSLLALFSPSLSLGAKVSVSSAHSVPWEPLTSAAALTDGDINTKWLAKADDPTPWAMIELGAAGTIKEVALRWADPARTPAYQIQTSEDGFAWRHAASVEAADKGRTVHRLAFEPRQGRFVKISIQKNTTTETVGIREVRVPAAR